MRSNVRGQSLVEMAFVLPLLLMLIFSIIDFGWYVFNYTSLENAARRGAEQASKEAPHPTNVGKTTDGCVQAIKAEAKRNLRLITLPDNQITIRYVNSDAATNPDNGRKIGSPIEVRVTYQGNFLTPLLPSIGIENISFDFRSRRSIMNTNITPEMVSVEGQAIGCQ
jgi:hypothetical protein